MQVEMIRFPENQFPELHFLLKIIFVKNVLGCVIRKFDLIKRKNDALQLLPPVFR